MKHILLEIAAAGLIVRILIYAAALAGAAIHYVQTAGAPRSARGLLRHLVPPEILRSRWTYADIGYYVADRLLAVVTAPVTTGAATACAALMAAALRTGVGPGPQLPLDALTLAVFLGLGLLARDFVSFYLHMMQHRVPLLWEFHKVHHAPETLLPVTSHRLHPLELCANLVGDAPVIGALAGTYAWLGGGGIDVIIVCSASLQLLVGLLTLAPLRHSHIDLRFGWFERFVLSPAHHRVHHSIEPEHWDKNFSAIFPFWDRAWQTLLPPPPSSSYRLGLPGGESAEYLSVTASYARPFRRALGRSRTEGWRALTEVGPLAGQPARLRPAPSTLDPAPHTVESPPSPG